MAAKTVDLTDAATVLKWSKDVGNESIWKSIFFNPGYGFMGTGSDRMICRKDDLQQGTGGGKVTIVLVMQLTGDGLVNGAQAEGNESNNAHHTDSLEIHELGSEPWAVQSQIAQQRVPWNLVENGKDVTSSWWQVPLNSGPAMHLAGSTFSTAVDYYKPHGRQIVAGSATDHQYTGMNASTTPTSGRHIWPTGETADEGLDSGDTLILDDIDRLIDMAPQMKPPIRPCRWAGGENYVIFIHQDQFSSLFSSTRYDAIQVARLNGGQDYRESGPGSGNVMAYRGAIFVVSLWNPPAQNSSTAAGLVDTRRAFLAGAQSLVCGWGLGHGQNKFQFHTEKFNIGGGVRMMSRSIWGCKKTVFNSKDYASLVLGTWAANVGDA